MPLATSSRKFKTERYHVYTLSVPNPAAGADVLWSAVDNTVAQIMGLSFGFTTANVGIDRWVFVENLSAAGDHVQRSVSLGPQALNVGRDYYFTRGVNPVDMTAVIGTFQCPLACDIEIHGTDQLCISAVRIDPADQFVYIDLRIREWNID
jgi:hypothetical protein